MHDTLPRLLYVADVPVESTQHGSALMFRLLEDYPAGYARIVETGLASQPAKRLSAVPYANVPIGRRSWLNSRFHGPYSAWLTWRAAAHADRIITSVSGFDAEAVVTVGHGFGWVAAAEVARRLRRPLHLIIHDDWPKLSAMSAALRPWLDGVFARVYRVAATRLCVSPFMADEFTRRYEAAGSVLYPSRSRDAVVFEAKTPQSSAGDAIVIGYGGNSGPDVLPGLQALARALAGSGDRLLVFGPFDESARRRLLSLCPSITFAGFVPYQQMIRGLRDMADVLFVPMNFDPAEQPNMTVSFPSKLADYTATGLPLLIHGPGYSSAVRWARAERDAAVIVDEPGEAGLRVAVDRLRDDPAQRVVLAANAVAAGRRCFDPAVARSALTAALLGARS